MTMGPIMTNRHSPAFSTLLVVIVLGGVALALTLTLSAASMWSIQGGTDLRRSVQARALVGSCAEVALEMMREDHAYVGDGSATVDGRTCDFTIADIGGSGRSITVRGTIGDVTRRLKIETSGFDPMAVSSWTEAP